MPNDFTEYYAALNMGQALHDRLTHLEKQVRTLTPEPLLDVFVSNWEETGEVSKYLSLFFFTENLLYEVRTFATNDTIECDVIRHRIHNLQYTIQNFDFNTPTPESRFSARYLTVNQLTAEFRATGGNCSQLWELTKKYLTNNLEPSPTSTG